MGITVLRSSRRQTLLLALWFAKLRGVAQECVTGLCAPCGCLTASEIVQEKRSCWITSEGQMFKKAKRVELHSKLGPLTCQWTLYSGEQTRCERAKSLI